MLEVSNISLQFGKRVLFDDVNLKFFGDSCYGVIGANGAGKSTFLKILSGEQAPTRGTIHIETRKRMAVLSQNHEAFNELRVIDTVIMGHKELWDLMHEKDALYAKPDFSDADGMKAAELEEQFAEMEGWNAESDAGILLGGLGINESMHEKLMSELAGNEKVRILLAQALFGNPDILVLDEPTNDLDLKSIQWLEDFLLDFKNTVIVVSHDRHFLDTVCTNIVDIDFNKINTFTGNYTFWYQSSQLATRQRAQQNKKAEAKKKELQEFISRFSANASKSKQATSRKKLLEKINVDDIQPSSRKYPGIIFTQLREAGNQILKVDGLNYSTEEGPIIKNLSFEVNRGDKIAFLSSDGLPVSALFKILMDELKADSGEIEFGKTITKAFMPAHNDAFFEKEISLLDWLMQYAKEDSDERDIRGFLGKMLFSGEEVFKSSKVLSGGEKVRCMLSKLMQTESNFLIFDEPTNHLDLESITALNNGLRDFKGTVLFTSHDHEFTQTIATRIIELTPNGNLDKMMTYDEYISSDRISAQKEELMTV